MMRIFTIIFYGYKRHHSICGQPQWSCLKGNFQEFKSKHFISVFNLSSKQQIFSILYIYIIILADYLDISHLYLIIHYDQGKK